MVLISKAKGADPVVTRAANEDKTPWYKKPNLRSMYLWLFPACMCVEATSGFDSQMINAAQIIPSWGEYFDEPQGALLGIIGASYSLGAICSLPFIPLVNDRYGRRWAIMFGSLVMITGAIVQGASVHVGMYIAARVMLGFGIPFCIVAGSALLGELGHPKERPVLTSLFNAAYFVGSLSAAGISFGTQQIPSDWGWRIPSLLQAAPSLVQVACIFFVPESPRFLISHDRREEALEILVKYHAEGDRDSPLVAAEMAQMETTIRLEKELNQQPWKDFVKKAGMRRRLVISGFLGLFTQWSGNTLISYYLSEILGIIGYTDPNFQGTLNVGLTAWNLANATVISLVVTRFRRRPAYLVCVISILCVYVGWTIANERFLATGNAAVGQLVIFFIFAYSPCYNIGYNALTYTFLVELWPFAQRSRGIAFFQLFGRLAGFFNTFVNPVGLANIGWRYLITYCVWVGFEIIIIWFLWPETYGRTLEELTFCAFLLYSIAVRRRTLTRILVFEPDERAEQQATAGEKQLFGEDVREAKLGSAVQIEEQSK